MARRSPSTRAAQSGRRGSEDTELPAVNANVSPYSPNLAPPRPPPAAAVGRPRPPRALASTTRAGPLPLTPPSHFAGSSSPTPTIPARISRQISRTTEETTRFSPPSSSALTSSSSSTTSRSPAPTPNAHCASTRPTSLASPTRSLDRLPIAPVRGSDYHPDPLGAMERDSFSDPMKDPHWPCRRHLDPDVPGPSGVQLRDQLRSGRARATEPTSGSNSAAGPSGFDGVLDRGSLGSSAASWGLRGWWGCLCSFV